MCLRLFLAFNLLHCASAIDHLVAYKYTIHAINERMLLQLKEIIIAKFNEIVIAYVQNVANRSGKMCL